MQEKRAGTEEKTVLTNYNFLRILAIFFVVATHVMMPVSIADPVTEPEAFHVRELVRTLTLTCNGLFFMLSGRFILEKYDGKMLRFYIDRIVKIGIPALLAAAFQFFYLYRAFDAETLKEFVRQFLASSVLGYLWFVFALFGFYLAVPFLVRMFQNMQAKEKRALLAVSFLVILTETLCRMKGLLITRFDFLFYGWIFYCILGYLLDTMGLSKKAEKGIMLLGAAGFLISALEELYLTGLNPLIHEYAPSMILMTAGLYMLVTRYGDVLTRHIGKQINLLSRYVFLIYLLHGFAQNLLFGMILKSPAHGYGMWLLLSLISFLIALFMAVTVYHLLYQPYLSFARKYILSRIDC